MKCTVLFVMALSMSGLSAGAQNRAEQIQLVGNKYLSSFNVSFQEESYKGKESLKVTGLGGDTEATFVKIGHLDFGDGIIEIDLAGKPAEGTFEGARGFVGIAFRINANNSQFECFYLRPTNGRADDQVRRNHSCQYISFPDFPWYRLREEFPKKYESYVDLVPGEWTRVKIEVRGDKSKLYVHGNEQPTLIVNDLKHGSVNNGSIGLWIGPGTEAHFSNLRVTKY